MRAIGYVPPDADLPTEHEYVRRFWAALLGKAGLEDLLRLSAAAQQGTRIRRPTHVHLLIAERLVRPLGGTGYLVPVRMPLLDPARLRRLPVSLRLEQSESALLLLRDDC